MENKAVRHLHLVLDELTYQKLCTDAKKCGMNRSTYLRRLIMKKTIRARPPAAIQELYREINHIGNNINQIARSVNAGIATAEDARRGLFMLEKVYEKLDEVIKG